MAFNRAWNWFIFDLFDSNLSDFVETAKKLWNSIENCDLNYQKVGNIVCHLMCRTGKSRVSTSLISNGIIFKRIQNIEKQVERKKNCNSIHKHTNPPDEVCVCVCSYELVFNDLEYKPIDNIMCAALIYVCVVYIYIICLSTE